MDRTIDQIRQVRAQTGLSIREIIAAFDKAGTIEDVYNELKVSAEIVRAINKPTSIRRLHSYVHHNGRCASIAEFGCETDFAANSKPFQELMHDVCMQIAATWRRVYPTVGSITEVDWVTNQPYMKDPSITVGQRIAQVSAVTKEKIALVWYTSKQL